MKNKIVIIGTYPEKGSKNIGDQLITNKLIELISEYGTYDFEVIWRADEWENVKGTINSASHVFFACLAIRPRMHYNEYPFLKHVVQSGVPFSVVSAGTSLDVSNSNNLFGGFSDDTVDLLRAINSKSSVCGTRGYLTQSFCANLGLNNFKFAGDVAFFNGDINNVHFKKGREVQRIVVSDPHYADMYLTSFKTLLVGLKNLFPLADIKVALHGVNPRIPPCCNELNIECVPIFKNPDSGLEIYDNIDLHVGYRVHGHVSALSRGSYSYLLEQDGRGCDYGLTIEKKISIPNYKPSLTQGISARILRKFTGFQPRKSVSSSAAQQLISLIESDVQDEFSRFHGLENQLIEFNSNLRALIAEALGS